MTASGERRAPTRQDLPALKALDRAGVYEVLGSFDPAGLSEEEFARRAAVLLDPARVPGLNTPSAEGIGAAAAAACAALAPPRTEPLAAAPGHVQQADDLLAHRFTFYGETHPLPADIDWDHNPGTGHWGHDLNRFSYLAPLVRAWRSTGNRRYARKAVELILDWVARADFGRAFVGTPYVFGSYLNQAIHCEAWALCLRQLLPAGLVAPGELLRILKSLRDQLAYLEIVTAGHEGNWPTIGCRGILATLAALPVFRDTDRWAEYSLRSLSAQAAAQVLPDGVQDELTPHYHWVVVSNLASAAVSARALGRELAPDAVAVLRRMVHYTQQTLMPDRSAQLGFNDSDPAAVPDLERVLEPAGLAGLLSPPEALGPELFPYAGVAFLRQPPARGDLYLAFDAGPFGRGHQHEDRLGFWLFAFGRSFLVDPGRHLYDSSAASYRPYLCSTRAHSTILVDGQGQHSRGRPDTWIARAPLPISWRTSPAETRVAGSYTLGYGEGNGIAVTHQRQIAFVQERFWVVFDRVTGDGRHEVESRFQFAPGPLRLLERGAVTGFEDANLLVRWAATPPWEEARIEAGQEDPRGGWYSARYGLIEPAPCLSLRATVGLPLFAATLLLPFRGATPPGVGLDLEPGAAVIGGLDPEPIRLSCQLGRADAAAGAGPAP